MLRNSSSNNIIMAITFAIGVGLFAAIFFGIANFYQKKTVDSLDTYSALAIYYIWVVIVIGTFTFATKSIVIPTFRTALLIIFTGSIGGISAYCFFEAMKRGKVSVISPLVHVSAIISVILSFIFLGEKITLMQGIGIILLIFGSMLISFHFSNVEKLHWTKRIAKGVPFAIITLIGWGIYHVLLKPIIQQVGAISSAFYLESFLLLFFLTPLLWGKKIKTNKKGIKVSIIAGIFLAIASILLNISIEKGLVSLIIPILAFAPLITSFLSFIFLKERLETNQYIAVIFIILGLISITL